MLVTITGPVGVIRLPQASCTTGGVGVVTADSHATVLDPGAGTTGAG
jgi:hypothetical protein